METWLVSMCLLDLGVHAAAVHIRLADKAVPYSLDISPINDFVEAHIEASQNAGKHNIQLCVGQAVEEGPSPSAVLP